MFSVLPLFALSAAQAVPQRIEAWPRVGQSPTDLEAAAQQLASSRDSALDQAHIEVRTAGLGHTALVHRIQDGIRSEHADLVVRFDESGAPRVTAYRPRMVQHASSSPIPAGEIPKVVARQLLHAEVTVVGPLRWWPLADALVPARAVVMASGWRGLETPVALVRDNGTVLDIFDLTAHLGSGADVYLTDPLLDPEVVRVALPAFAGEGLHSRHFDLYQCHDDGGTYATNSELGEVELRWCEPHLATLAGDKDWVFEPVPYPLDPALDEDRFALPHLVWHGELVVEMLADIGLPLDDVHRDWTRLAVLANQRTTDLRDTTTMSSPDAPLATYDNAYFRRAWERDDGSWTDPEVVFGQGSIIDFAYDADVVTHELGHWAVWMQGGPSHVRSSVHGASAEPGALNEGLADYFAAIRQDDPIIGAYSGDGLGRPYIRTLDGDASCPHAIYGQVHADSQPFSQALWGFRTTLSADEQAILDRSVVDALPVIGSQGGFTDAVDALVAELGLQLDNGAATALREAFAARQVDACVPHLHATAGEVVRSYSRVPAFHADLYDLATPGYLQFIIDADGPLDVTVELVQKESLEVDLWGTNAPRSLFVLANAGGPIEHSPYTDADTDEWVWQHNGAVVGEVSWAAELETALDGRSKTHAFAGTFSLYGEGPHYLQLANLSPRLATAYDLTFDWSPGEPRGDTGLPSDPREPAGPKDDGCGCAAATTNGTGLMLVAVLAVARRRSDPAWSTVPPVHPEPVVPTSEFHSDPSRLPGLGGAFLRGEADLPDGATWLPAPRPELRARRHGKLLVGGSVMTGLGTALLEVLPFPDIVALLTVAFPLAIGLDMVRRHPASALTGRRGLLLLPELAQFHFENHCGVVLRADVTGVERRNHPARGIRGALTLSARTGRGALPSPIRGDAALAQLRGWVGT